MDYANTIKSNNALKDHIDNINYEEIIDIDSMDNNGEENAINNVKRILCYTTLVEKNCHYGKKCMYAHTLDDQKIDDDRMEAYKILKNNSDLSNINLLSNNKLFISLKQLTKLCSYCMKGCCPGGYNCKFGTFDKKYQVCYDDLMSGNCKKKQCGLQHLTIRGLKPYNDQISVKELQPKIQRIIGCKKIPKSVFIKSSNIEKSELEGILLTDSFFNKTRNESESSCMSESDEEIEKTIQYLNSHSDSNEDSIFIE